MLATTVRAELLLKAANHEPVGAHLVPELIEDMCDYVNDHWEASPPLHLAAYLMWRLNWIHPFADGNGRTSRIVSYVALSIRAGAVLPGTPTIPDQIVDNRNPYFEALDAADAAYRDGKIDVSKMETLLAAYLRNNWQAFIRQRAGNCLNRFNLLCPLRFHPHVARRAGWPTGRMNARPLMLFRVIRRCVRRSQLSRRITPSAFAPGGQADQSPDTRPTFSRVPLARPLAGHKIRLPRVEPPRLERAAAPIAPDGAVGADAGARHNHDGTHDPGSNHDDAIGTASAIGTAMEAGSAAACGLRRAKARERAGKQNCCKKGLHVYSVVLGRAAAPGHHSIR